MRNLMARFLGAVVLAGAFTLPAAAQNVQTTGDIRGRKIFDRRVQPGGCLIIGELAGFPSRLHQQHSAIVIRGAISGLPIAGIAPEGMLQRGTRFASRGKR